MTRSQRGLLVLLTSLPVLLIFSALLYMVGMERLEEQPRSFWQALEWAGETLSTTGYGGDHGWGHPAMVVYVVLLQFAGVFLIFLIFPIYLIPFLEERFEARLPREIKDVADHVLIYQYGPAVASLIPELEQAGLETVVIEKEESEARQLLDRGPSVVLGSLDDGVLDRVELLKARAVIANGEDEENAAFVLSARQMGFSGEALALVEEPYHRQPLTLAGATAAFTPRHVLGAALAARASSKVQPRVAGIQLVGRRLRVSEIRLGPASKLVGKTLEEAELGKKAGVVVLGQWVGGHLKTPATSDMVLEKGGIVVLLGSDESLERFSDLAGGSQPLNRSGPLLVAGYGEVGSKVVELLRQVEEEVVVIDRRHKEGVDIVGDVLEPEVLTHPTLKSAQGIVLALDSDAATLFATVILKDRSPDIPIIARVNRAENVERIHRAGADFALSISQVSGQILAKRLLGHEAVVVDSHLRVVRVPEGSLVGHHPSELRIRARTGCSIVAVERGEDALTEFDVSFRFAAGDAVYLCGDREAIRRYEAEFPAA